MGFYMDNLDTYKKAKEKTDCEINAHLQTRQLHNEATSLAIAYLNDYLPWYKIKFKAKGGGYISRNYYIRIEEPLR